MEMSKKRILWRSVFLAAVCAAAGGMKVVSRNGRAQIIFLVSILSILSTAAVSAAETAYLRPGDVIVCVGDSVTAAVVYGGLF